MVDPVVKAYVDGEIAKESTALTAVVSRLSAVEQRPAVPADFDTRVEKVIKAVKAKADPFPTEPYKLGAQGAAVGGQFFKFDLTMLKYDEKGFTFLGRPLIPGFSLNALEQKLEKGIKGWWADRTGKTVAEAAKAEAEKKEKESEERRKQAQQLRDLRSRLDRVFLRKTEAGVEYVKASHAASTFTKKSSFEVVSRNTLLMRRELIPGLERRVGHVEERLLKASAAAKGLGPGGKGSKAIDERRLRETNREVERLNVAVRELVAALG